jgi:cell wall-associated NlpC family hydrolase
MRPIRLLILLLVLTAALAGLLVKPLPGQAGTGTTDTTGTTETTDTTTAATATTAAPTAAQRRAQRRHRRLVALHRKEHAIVHYARRFIGTPYSWGGTSPRTGFDCSGFVRYVYAHFGVKLPHSSFSDLWHGRRVVRKHLVPGDLVFFDGNNHVGIYIGGNRMIHAPHTGAVVSITTMTGWYGREYDAGRRLLPRAS